VRVFWGPPEAPQGQVNEVPWSMRLPPLLIALLALEFEFLPAVADPLLLAAAQSVSPGLAGAQLDASYTLGGTLSALGVTLGLGLVLFLVWDRLHAGLHRLHWLDHYGPGALFDNLLHAIPRLAAWQTRLLQPGSLTAYLRLALAGLLVMGLGLHLLGDAALRLDWPALLAWPANAWAWAVATLLMVAGAVSALFIRRRIALLMASGLVGYGSALLFLFAGAPDLAFTQFAVESVLVVMAASILFHLRPVADRSHAYRAVDYVLAGAAGLATFLLLAHLAALEARTELATWFGAHSLSHAHGHNVVNVIIVDFRALDTLGEIAVLAFSLLAAWPLLTALSRRRA